MLYRTVREAQSERSEMFRQVVGHVVEVRGRQFVRTYQHNPDYSCKQCRRSSAAKRRRGVLPSMPAVGNVACECCGNPFSSVSRQPRRMSRNGFETVRDCWVNGGKLW